MTNLRDTEDGINEAGWSKAMTGTRIPRVKPGYEGRFTLLTYRDSLEIGAFKTLKSATAWATYALTVSPPNTRFVIQHDGATVQILSNINYGNLLELTS